MAFDPSILSWKDQRTARALLGWDFDAGFRGKPLERPDVDIQPEGQPYLYRWHVVPRNMNANVYLHVQVASDPERPLHDHPWDNQSVILSGGYVELTQLYPPYGTQKALQRHVGQTIHRRAEEAHRLLLPSDVPYTMTLFTTGPTKRDWGFWVNSHRGRPEWVSHTECLIDSPDGRSLFKYPARLA